MGGLAAVGRHAHNARRWPLAQQIGRGAGEVDRILPRFRCCRRAKEVGWPLRLRLPADVVGGSRYASRAAARRAASRWSPRGIMGASPIHSLLAVVTGGEGLKVLVSSVADRRDGPSGSANPRGRTGSPSCRSGPVPAFSRRGRWRGTSHPFASVAEKPAQLLARDAEEGQSTIPACRGVPGLSCHSNPRASERTRLALKA